MALSKSKLARLEAKRRRDRLNHRSINGTGRWLDANHEMIAKEYLLTGQEELLDQLPDYSHNRRPKNA